MHFEGTAQQLEALETEGAHGTVRYHPNEALVILAKVLNEGDRHEIVGLSRVFGCK